jgi:hypothetical protein
MGARLKGPESCKGSLVTDILDDIAIHLNCATEGCAGEIRSTFGRLRANPEVVCHMCNTRTEVHFSEEELAQAREALAAAKAGADGGT